MVSGENGSLCHGVPGERTVRDGDFITMDFGALWGGYCSDMTRTVAVGHVSEEQRRVYDTVLRAQEAGIAAAHAVLSARSSIKSRRTSSRRQGTANISATAWATASASTSTTVSARSRRTRTRCPRAWS